MINRYNKGQDTSTPPLVTFTPLENIFMLFEETFISPPLSSQATFIPYSEGISSKAIIPENG